LFGVADTAVRVRYTVVYSMLLQIYKLADLGRVHCFAGVCLVVSGCLLTRTWCMCVHYRVRRRSCCVYELWFDRCWAAV